MIIRIRITGMMTVNERRCGVVRDEVGRKIDVPASAWSCPNVARPIAMPTGVVMAKVKASVGLNALRIHLARKKN